MQLKLCGTTMIFLLAVSMFYKPQTFMSRCVFGCYLSVGVVICFEEISLSFTIANFVTIHFEFDVVDDVIVGMTQIVGTSCNTCGYGDAVKIDINSSVAFAGIQLTIICIKLYESIAVDDISRNSSLNLRDYSVLFV